MTCWRIKATGQSGVGLFVEFDDAPCSASSGKPMERRPSSKRRAEPVWPLVYWPLPQICNRRDRNAGPNFYSTMRAAAKRFCDAVEPNGRERV
jgi:hypothetical protein